jgi:hypothetical protein
VQATRSEPYPESCPRIVSILRFSLPIQKPSIGPLTAFRRLLLGLGSRFTDRHPSDHHRYRIDRSCKKRMIGSMPLVIGRMPVKNAA